MPSVSEVLDEAKKCHVAGDLPRAEQLFCKVIPFAEDHPEPYFHLGTIYAQTGNHGRAITFLKKTLELEPQSNGAMMNLASVYRQIENRERAKHWIEQALAIERTPYVLSNMAGLYVNAGQPAEAVKWADEALTLSPELAQAANHKALALLEMGRFEEGWALYDARLRLPEFHRRSYTCPRWGGTKVGTLAISGEQGLGDEIMFMSCMKQIEHLADQFVIECAVRLVPLFRNTFPRARIYGTFDELDAKETPDAWIQMGSIPGLIWPVVPNVYLRPSLPARKRDKATIGISWFGGAIKTHGLLRNAPVIDWRALLDLQAGFISLQYGEYEADAATLGIPHDSAAISDLDLLATRIARCDLVISVCNTTIHMAGALGVPCICLVPSKPAWRYGLSGERMVWYDSVRLVRQTEGEEWASVIQRAKDICVTDHRFVPRTQQQAA